MIKTDIIAELIEKGLKITVGSVSADGETVSTEQTEIPKDDPTVLTEQVEIPEDDPLFIVPTPDLKELKEKGAAAVDLRLGTWFVTLRQARIPYLQAGEKLYEGELSGGQLTKSHYVPFGDIYWLHPQSFVLGVTLEWLRLPLTFGGYVTSRSSWGRRGLVIATATGVHPGFTGCLTLELSNVGEIPIPLRPGMALCQLFLHRVETGSLKTKSSDFAGTRRPKLGEIKPDNFFKGISDAYKITE